jgi:hypothetical protein
MDFYEKLDEFFFCAYMLVTRSACELVVCKRLYKAHLY